MIKLSNGDIVIASNGDRGIVAENDILWASEYHPKEDIAFCIRYTETDAEIEEYKKPDFLPTLEIGSRGLMVVLVQTALQCKGYYKNCKVDGDFGNKTFEAVREFRKDNYLSGDTVVDYETYKCLFKE